MQLCMAEKKDALREMNSRMDQETLRIIRDQNCMHRKQSKAFNA